MYCPRICDISGLSRRWTFRSRWNTSTAIEPAAFRSFSLSPLVIFWFVTRDAERLPVPGRVDVRLELRHDVRERVLTPWEVRRHHPLLAVLHTHRVSALIGSAERCEGSTLRYPSAWRR